MKGSSKEPVGRSAGSTPSGAAPSSTVPRAGQPTTGTPANTGAGGGRVAETRTGQTGTNARAKPTADRPFAHLRGADKDENLAKYGTPTEALERARKFSEQRRAMEVPTGLEDAPAPRGTVINRIPSIDEIREMTEEEFDKFLESLPEEDRPRFEKLDRSTPQDDE